MLPNCFYVISRSFRINQPVFRDALSGIEVAYQVCRLSCWPLDLLFFVKRVSSISVNAEDNSRE